MKSIPLPNKDIERWEFTRLARRILYGAWKDDLKQRIRYQAGTDRERAWRSTDISCNVFRACVDNLAVLYDRPPTINHDQLHGRVVIDELHRSGIWSMMKRIQRDTLALREMFIRIEYNDRGLTFRPVFPDMVECETNGNDPGTPVVINELRLWNIDGVDEYVWEVFNLRTPEYRLERRIDGTVEDITQQVHGRTFSGHDYPWMYDQRPYLPYVLYHAQNTGYLFDPYASIELVEGTLQAGVNYSFLGHNIRNASWPQRWIVNAQAAGGDLLEGRSEVTVDPTSVALFESIKDGIQPQIGQWETASDPATLLECITQYERRLVTFAGVNPADLQRASGDPSSGYALAITREAQRAAQRQYESQFRVHDLELISKSAMVLELNTGVDVPVNGYTIIYPSIPLSAEEEQQTLDRVDFLLQSKLITKERAFSILFPNETYIPISEGEN